MSATFCFDDGDFLKEKLPANPEEVILEFIRFFGTRDVLIEIWKMYKASVNPDAMIYEEQKDCQNLLFFTECFLLYNKAVFALYGDVFGTHS